MKKKLLTTLCAVTGAFLMSVTGVSIAVAQDNLTDNFASTEITAQNFTATGTASQTNGALTFSKDSPAMYLSKESNLKDFTLDVKWEVLNEEKTAGSYKGGVLIRANNEASDTLTGGLSGLMIGLEYNGSTTMQVSIGNWFNGVYEPVGYWDAGWGNGFAERNLKIIVKGDVVSIIINNWHAHTHVEKYFDAGSVGFLSNGLSFKVDDLKISDAPENIYTAIVREQWKGFREIGTGVAFAEGQNHTFKMSLPSAVQNATKVTMYRRAEPYSNASASVTIDGQTLGDWSGKNEDVAHDIPLSFVKNKSEITFSLTAKGSGDFNSDYYILTYTTPDGTFVADSLDMGSAHDEKAHSYTQTGARWKSFWQRDWKTTGMRVLSARPGERFDYIKAPTVSTQDIEIDSLVADINLNDYVTITGNGLKTKITYTVDGKVLTDVSSLKFYRGGTHTYSIKVESVPDGTYSEKDCKAFDDINVSGTIKLATLSEEEKTPITLNKEQVKDKILGAWVGANWGIYAGLDTECKYNDAPNPATEITWNLGDSYCTDDDTNVEYMFLHMMETYGVNDIAYEDFAEEWMTHCQNYIWCANLVARTLMENGYLPPDTGSKKYNESWSAIDAQIECEIFGMIAPAMLEDTYTRTKWWLKSVGDGVAVENACYYAMMCSYAFVESDINKILDEVNEKIMYYSNGEAQQTVDDVNFVRDEYEKVKDKYATDKEAWRETRLAIKNKIYNGNTVDARTNFAVTIMALLFGDGDEVETGRISVLAGWDNDCDAATALTVLGITNGYSGLNEEMKEKSGMGYFNSRRPGLTTSTFPEITDRIMAQAEEVILANGGTVSESEYNVIDKAYTPKEYVARPYLKEVAIDNTFTSEGFSKVYIKGLKNSIGYTAREKGAYLEYEFEGTSIEVTAMLCQTGGSAEIFVDGVSYGIKSLRCDPADGASGIVKSVFGQTIAKIRGLENTKHTLKIVTMSDNAQHVFDFVRLECSEEEWKELNPTTVNIAREEGVTIIASVMTPGAASGGNKDISIIRDGAYFTNFNDLKQQYDTFLGFDSNGALIPKDYEDYIGYEFSEEKTFTSLMFQEGGHWAGGGWFANGTIRVEVKVDGTWQEVATTFSKAYPNANQVGSFGVFGEKFTITLKTPTTGTAIRLIGTAGGPQKLISCAELEVYAK